MTPAIFGPNRGGPLGLAGRLVPDEPALADGRIPAQKSEGSMMRRAATLTMTHAEAGWPAPNYGGLVKLCPVGHAEYLS